AFCAALEASAARRRSTAASKSPCVSASAFLQAMTPAPVLSRSVFTRVALIPAMLSPLLRLQEKGNEFEQRGRRRNAADQDHLQPFALPVVDRVDSQRTVRRRAAV